MKLKPLDLYIGSDSRECERYRPVEVGKKNEKQKTSRYYRRTILLKNQRCGFTPFYFVGASAPPLALFRLVHRRQQRRPLCWGTGRLCGGQAGIPGADNVTITIDQLRPRQQLLSRRIHGLAIEESGRTRVTAAVDCCSDV